MHEINLPRFKKPSPEELFKILKNSIISALLNLKVHKFDLDQITFSDLPRDDQQTILANFLFTRELPFEFMNDDFEYLLLLDFETILERNDFKDSVSNYATLAKHMKNAAFVYHQERLNALIDEFLPEVKEISKEKQEAFYE